MSRTTLHWFRQDLRQADNPALTAACVGTDALICVYVLDERMGAAQRWWLHFSLQSLGDSLKAKGQRLLLCRGDPAAIVRGLVERFEIDRLCWNRVFGPDEIARDKALRAELLAQGVEVASSNGSLGREPWEVTQDGGRPYKVYTPFAKAWFKQGELPAPEPVPERLPPPPPDLDQGDELAAWCLLPTAPDWASGFWERWGGAVGEAGAGKALTAFIGDCLGDYSRMRDIPASPGTSRMSAHLHFGEIAPRQIVHAVQGAVQANEIADSRAFPYLRQIVWRDFAHATLFHFPELVSEPLRPEFRRFPWADDPDRRSMRAWQAGRTGYPIVDAGMRELWHTGWLHNRVRMIVGSFLTKDLRLPWQDGAAWFMDTLIDADLANNSMGWQWIAGCGIDAAPYFRVFNPILQGTKFDPQGDYVRRWVPELAKLPDRYLHAPFDAPDPVLKEAGVTLGESYPFPLVDHAKARDAALAAYRAVRGGLGEDNAA